MRWGSAPLGALILIVTLALLIFLELLPFLEAAKAARQSGPSEGPPSFGAKFAALPPWVKIWMHFQDMIIGASLFFVLWKKEAQIYAASIIASHVFLFALMPLISAEKLTLGFASLSHWLWIPALIILIRAWPRVDKKTGYGVWVSVAIVQLIFSLSFDIPDGYAFLASLT